MAGSSDHRVCLEEEHQGHREPERLGRLEIDDQLKFPHSPGFRGRRIASEDEGRSPLHFPLISDVRSQNSRQNYINDIKTLEFYH